VSQAAEFKATLRPVPALSTGSLTVPVARSTSVYFKLRSSVRMVPIILTAT